MISIRVKQGVALFGLFTLAACGLRFDSRAPWRDELEAKCLQSGAVQSSAAIVPMEEIDGPGACGMMTPLRVASFGQGSIPLKNKVTLSCPALSSVDRWMTEVVQPAAQIYYGTQIAEVKAGSYSCRNRNHEYFGKISEHAFGNAMDVMGFRFADGRTITVAKGWKGEPKDQGFLREIFVHACDYFTTVLAPGSDAAHADHIHMDLARHDEAYKRRICQPKIQFARKINPRPDANQIAGLNYVVPDVPRLQPTAIASNASEDDILRLIAETSHMTPAQAALQKPSITPIPQAQSLMPKSAAVMSPDAEDEDYGDLSGIY
jgi:hypothetical protein